LRLQLGDDAVETVRNHVQPLLADMKQWKKPLRSTGF
jgi:hypothetical protein